MPLQEAKISTNIRLRFRTHQDNAIILLAAGRTDYCLLGLDAGRLKFYFKVDDYLTEVIYKFPLRNNQSAETINSFFPLNKQMWSPKKFILNDLEWHDIAIQRYEANVTLQIDDYFVRFV